MPEIHGAISNEGRRIKHDAIDILWESGDQSSKLDSDIAMTSSVTDTQAFTSFTRSITGLSTTNTAGRLRITASPGLVGGGQRNFIPITGSDSKDSEVRSLWYDKAAVGANQMGHVHRIQANGSGFTWGFIVWQDVAFSTESIMDTAIWTGQTPAGGNNADMTIHFSTNTPTTEDVTGLQNYMPVRGVTHQGTTVNITTFEPHNCAVGHYVKMTNSEINDTTGGIEVGQLTAVTEYTMQYTSAINYGFVPSYTSPIGSKVLLVSRIMPHWVCSQLVGGVLRVKTWPEGVGEPSWSDPKYSFRVDAFPITGPPAGTMGKCGIYAGHLAANGTNWLEYGAVSWRSLD